MFIIEQAYFVISLIHPSQQGKLGLDEKILLFLIVPKKRKSEYLLDSHSICNKQMTSNKARE